MLTNAKLEPTTVLLTRPATTSKEVSDVSPLTALPTTRGFRTRKAHFFVPCSLRTLWIAAIAVEHCETRGTDSA